MPNESETHNAPLKELRLLRKGDPEAMRRWFDTNADGLFAFVHARVNKNRDVARDITQQVLGDALHNIKQFDPQRAGMATWLRMRALNPIRKAQTRLGREHAMPGEEALHRQWADAGSRELPAETLARAETRELVDATLRNLPDHYRSVLRSRYVEDASLADIASAQNSSVTTIKPLLHRAREAFREEFERLAAVRHRMPAVPPA